MTDFEASMRKAIIKCYPNVALHGCWFHYCAAIRRKALSLGLYDLLKNNWNARSIYRKLKSWPLLPSSKTVEGFELIEEETRNVGLHKDFETFLIYFKNYWLKLVYFIHLSIHPLYIKITFIQSVFIIFKDKKNSISVANLNNRTTSPLESFHSAMNRSVPKHANFFVFIDGVKLFESKKSDELYNVIHAKPSANLNKAIRKEAQERDVRIRSLTELICSGAISTKQFLEAMAEDDQCMYENQFQLERQ